MGKLFASISIVLWLTMTPGVAQTPEPAQTPPQAPAPTATPEASIHGYGERDKSCVAWTDACRTCGRAADGNVTCSNIGIACQPAEISCSVRQPEPAPAPAPAK
jgi:hypothetical protein